LYADSLRQFTHLFCCKVTYKADSSKTSSRKRNRESPEIEITQILTKEDKIESVTLSSDSEKDDTDDDEAQIDLSLLEKHSGSFTTAQDSADLNSNRSMSPTLQVPYYSTPEGGIVTYLALSSLYYKVHY